MIWKIGILVLLVSAAAGRCAEPLAVGSKAPQVRAVDQEGRPVDLGKAAEKGLTFPLGLDRSGKLLVLYRMASCPQITFIYPGGVVQSPALLERVSRPELRAHVAALVAAARARGWRAPGRAG